MSAPRTKRQFAGASADPTQRQITSFFQSSDSEAAANSSPVSNPAVDPSRYPILPSQVQTNLLSVGMRIRKSVPEGYKTSGHSAFKLWTDSSVTTTRKSPRSSIKTTPSELLPFCGINKVGGLDVQSFGEDPNDEDDYVPGLDDMPDMTFSQESVDNSADTEPSRKRIYEEEEEDETVILNPGLEGDNDFSLRSLASVGQGKPRLMAIPKSKTKKHTVEHMLGQENMQQGEDFEEAGFLVMDMAN